MDETRGVSGVARKARVRTVATLRLDWQDHAACLNHDSQLFFGPDGERHVDRATREREAVRLCGSCPVRSECLDYALTTPEVFGVWGGMTEDERALERRRRRTAA